MRTRAENEEIENWLNFSGSDKDIIKTLKKYAGNIIRVFNPEEKKVKLKAYGTIAGVSENGRKIIFIQKLSEEDDNEVEPVRTLEIEETFSIEIAVMA